MKPYRLGCSLSPALLPPAAGVSVRFKEIRDGLPARPRMHVIVVISLSEVRSTIQTPPVPSLYNLALRLVSRLIPPLAFMPSPDLSWSCSLTAVIPLPPLAHFSLQCFRIWTRLSRISPARWQCLLLRMLSCPNTVRTQMPSRSSNGGSLKGCMAGPPRSLSVRRASRHRILLMPVSSVRQ
jgi:hypothetical protein